MEAGCAGGGQGEGANGALSNYAERFTLTIHQNIDKICRAERSVLKLIDRKQRKTRGRSAPGLLCWVGGTVFRCENAHEI